jgi:hypothetical protein
VGWGSFWEWLVIASNREFLTWIGGAFSAVVMASWALFKYNRSQTMEKDDAMSDTDRQKNGKTETPECSGRSTTNTMDRGAFTIGRGAFSSGGGPQYNNVGSGTQHNHAVRTANTKAK